MCQLTLGIEFNSPFNLPSLDCFNSHTKRNRAIVENERQQKGGKKSLFPQREESAAVHLCRFVALSRAISAPESNKD